ncbi:MAG: efflux RND transporter periplasmic adaptor subunit [Gammaproteobacteria bacterium]|nr:efflux RND transporter periplasmic adaptor subunit [Gammaproteobacteria bacterium]
MLKDHQRRPGSGFFFVLLIAMYAHAAGAQAPASLVRVDPVRNEPLEQTVPVLGRLVAKRAGTVAARIAGPVVQIRVQVGSRVTTDDVIAELDAETLQAAHAVASAGRGEAQARLATSKAEQVLAEQQRRRYERLKDATSKSLYEDARQGVAIAAARVEEARAGLLSAQAALRVTELNLAYAQVRAPYDGVVTERLIEVGSYVQAGQALVHLVSDRELEVEADVPFERLGGMQPGATVDVTLDDGTRHVAEVRTVIPTENPQTRTRRVRFVPRFGSTRLALAVDQSATVHVPAGAPREVLSVHKDAINKRGGADIVFVVMKETVGEREVLLAKPRQVRLGEPVGNRFEVLQGLQLGERVVVRGNERLRPDTPVRVEESAS